MLRCQGGYLFHLLDLEGLPGTVLHAYTSPQGRRNRVWGGSLQLLDLLAQQKGWAGSLNLSEPLWVTRRVLLSIKNINVVYSVHH